ncbi:MAG: hypothetical protein JW807_17920 [Spirochaetes bacterium]|nr:hypothetical protein [Spirochaetota bacterium]
MIRLKNGYVVAYNKDFDVFFQDLLESIVRESRRSAESVRSSDDGLSPNELFLKELMDNCIYVTHQLFDMAKTREEFSRFMVTGFIFNSILCSLPVLEGASEGGDEQEAGDESEDDEGRVH